MVYYVYIPKERKYRIIYIPKEIIIYIQSELKYRII